MGQELGRPVMLHLTPRCLPPGDHEQCSPRAPGSPRRTSPFCLQPSGLPEGACEAPSRCRAGGRGRSRCCVPPACRAREQAGGLTGSSFCPWSGVEGLLGGSRCFTWAPHLQLQSLPRMRGTGRGTEVVRACPRPSTERGWALRQAPDPQAAGRPDGASRRLWAGLGCTAAHRAPDPRSSDEGEKSPASCPPCPPQPADCTGRGALKRGLQPGWHLLSRSLSGSRSGHQRNVPTNPSPEQQPQEWSPQATSVTSASAT